MKTEIADRMMHKVYCILRC